jgi:putative nucleotidyltransferase with HDIG domain
MHQEAGQQFLAELPGIEHDLPFAPDLLEKLFQQTRKDSFASLDAIADTISHDQGLSAKILSLANSAFYGLQAQVSSISRAIAVLGLREVRNIVLTLGISQLSHLHPPPAAFDLKEYWRHQLVVAASTKTLACMVQDVNADAMFAAGLLHDLGKLIIAMHRPADWEAIHRMTTERTISFLEAEELHWGLDHAIVGALVLRSWSLPAEVTEAVNWHHNPEFAPEFRAEAEVLRMADAMAYLVKDPETPLKALWEKLASSREIDHADALQRLDRDLDMDALEHFICALV